MKTFNKQIVHFFIITATFIYGCNTQSTKESIVQTENVLQKEKFRYHDEVLDIVNECIKNLLPSKVVEYAKQKSTGTVINSNLYVNELLLVASEKVVDSLIGLGASPLLNGICKKNVQPEYIHSWKLENYENIIVTSIPPMNTKELNANIGGVNFSHIIFSNDKTKAACIFEYAHFQKVENNVFCAVELEKINTRWKIRTLTKINKQKNISLYEYLP